ncbi:MAG: GGDEF domain-containing protein [Lachnospiraceae bacterium]|nr:GGDEF domain-containing protein [Lachnospiraceae bacterium]
MTGIDNSKIQNAIRSLYQMILDVDGETDECRVIDYNAEIKNISDEISSFGEFCKELLINIHPEDREFFAEFTDPEYYREILKRRVYVAMECRVKHTNLCYFWSEITLCNEAAEDKAGGMGFLFLIRDIHYRKMRQLQKEAGERAMLQDLQERYNALFEENMTDQQTGCYNRKGLKFYSDMVLREAQDEGKQLFVCVADLNGLKHLNDTYGHAAGDEAIAAVSAELKRSAPKGSRIVRTGGDEFLMFAAVDKDSTEPEELDDRIDAGLKEYNEKHPNPFTIGASYGWIVKPVKEGMTDLDEYIAIADEKMYEMKLERDKYRRDTDRGA